MTNNPMATIATENATGTGDTAAVVGQVQPNTTISLVGVHQPSLSPSLMANTSAPNRMALKSAPSTSHPRRCFSPLVSCTGRMAASNTRTPEGWLTKKTPCHGALWVTAPPASGPTAAAPEITAPQTPKATARYLPRNTAFTVDKVDGIINAAPTAWMA